MDATTYNIIHIIGLLLLTGFAFDAFAAPTPERKKRSAILTGVLAFVVLLGGFGLKAKLPYLKDAWPMWLILKLVCWLGVTALAGMVFKRPQMAGVFRWITIALLVAAVFLVFHGRGTVA